MQQSHDRLNAQLAQSCEPRVGPRPIGSLNTCGRGALPQHRVAHGANAERGDQVEVACALGVAIALKLIEVTLADTVHRAFDARP